jgi:D-arabinose 5-phosphate isomerase GutQ
VVALSAVQRLEQGKPVREGTAQAVERALAKAGIVFVSGDGQEGVILKRRAAR